MGFPTILHGLAMHSGILSLKLKLWSPLQSSLHEKRGKAILTLFTVLYHCHYILPAFPIRSFFFMSLVQFFSHPPDAPRHNISNDSLCPAVSVARCMIIIVFVQ